MIVIPLIVPRQVLNTALFGLILDSSPWTPALARPSNQDRLGEPALLPRARFLESILPLLLIFTLYTPSLQSYS